MKGPSFREALIRAKLGAAIIIRAIERLGLRVSIAKTKAMAFMWEVPVAKIRIGNSEIEDSR